MTKYEKIYRQAFGYVISDFIPCEVCGAGAAMPPHHITEKSQGGKDVIENLMALCMNHHDDYHTGGRMDKRLHRKQLYDKHLEFMDKNNVTA